MQLPAFLCEFFLLTVFIGWSYCSFFFSFVFVIAIFLARFNRPLHFEMYKNSRVKQSKTKQYKKPTLAQWVICRAKCNRRWFSCIGQHQIYFAPYTVCVCVCITIFVLFLLLNFFSFILWKNSWKFWAAFVCSVHIFYKFVLFESLLNNSLSYRTLKLIELLGYQTIKLQIKCLCRIWFAQLNSDHIYIYIYRHEQSTTVSIHVRMSVYMCVVGSFLSLCVWLALVFAPLT